MKKRVITILLTGVLALSLVACGGSTQSDSAETESEQEESSEEEIEETEDDVEFEEMTVVDNDECSITITGLTEDSVWGYTIKVALENKSAEKTYMFSVESASVNGVQSDPYWASEVAAGKKANGEISFSDSDLEDNGITEFTDVELSFRVYDSEDWSTDAVAEETVHIYPMGQDNATTYEREASDDDQVIVDNDYLKVVVTGYDHDDIWGYIANLYIENKTDRTIMVSADQVSVNGYMIDPFWAMTVYPGKCAFSQMTWDDTDLEDNDISEVEEIEFLLNAYDYDDYSVDDYVNETVTLNP